MRVDVILPADLQQDLWELKISGFGAAYLPWDFLGFSPEGRAPHVWLSLPAADVEDVSVAGSPAAYFRSIVVMVDSSDDIAAIVDGVADASLVELVELTSVVVFVCFSFDPARHVFADLSWIVNWVRRVQDHLASFLDDFGILGDWLAGWEKRGWLFWIGEDGGKVGPDHMRDWVGEMRWHFVWSRTAVKMIGDDVIDVLSGRDRTLIWSILFSCILSRYNITLSNH